MRLLIAVLLTFLGGAGLTAVAQEKSSGMSLTSADEMYTPLAEQDEDTYLNGMITVATFAQEEQQLPDSLHLPTVEQHPTTYYPYYWVAPSFGGYGLWQLHEGLNASLDLSAFTSFGKGHIGGTAEQISAAYAHAFNDHLFLAVGGYFSNMNTNRGDYRAAGIAALLNYRFDEHWEAFLYAQKSLLNTTASSHYGRWNNPYPYDYFGNFNDRLGIGVRYNFNPSTFVELRFDVERTPNPFPRIPQPKSANIDNTSTLSPTSSPRR